MKMLSIVIPAYKQEKTIVSDVKSIIEALDFLECDYEIIIVVDGMVDGTYDKAKSIKSKKVKIISYEKNQGKGHAVRFGMMQAKGEIIGFIDSGMDINPTGFRMLLNHMEWYNADVIVGSKLHPVSKVNYPFFRKVLSWGYRQLTATLFGFRVRDTQVGIKFFKKDVIKNILPRLLVKRYAFDIEVLAVAYKLGYTRIFEAPVEISFNNSSSIISGNWWKILLHMLWDTLAVYYRLQIKNYYVNASQDKKAKAKLHKR